MAEATVPHGESPACSCFVYTVLACVPAGARRAPAELSSRPVRARSAGARRATPSPTTSAAAARAPALPSYSRRQEAAEPVPLHGGSRHSIPAPCYSLWPAEFRETGLNFTRSVPFRYTPPRSSAPLGSARLPEI